MTPASNLSEKLSSLKSKDPGFNEQQFLDRTSTGFFKIQNAWCERNMNLARAYISDNVLRRFSLQLEEHKKK
jgi:predicted lipid-binding transport protein (Tim44 family)